MPFTNSIESAEYIGIKNWEMFVVSQRVKTSLLAAGGFGT